MEKQQLGGDFLYHVSKCTLSYTNFKSGIMVLKWINRSIESKAGTHIYIHFIYYLFICNIYSRSCSCGKSLALEQEADLCDRKEAHRPLARPFLCLYSTIRQPQVGRKFQPQLPSVYMILSLSNQWRKNWWYDNWLSIWIKTKSDPFQLHM